MIARYPNLELLEFICSIKVKELYGKIVNTQLLKFEADVFMQNWPNTSCGINLNNPVSGQAFTDAYTTVFKVRWYNEGDKKWEWKLSEDCIYFVFFNGVLAYDILNPNQLFFDGLEHRNLVSQKEAMELYM